MCSKFLVIKSLTQLLHERYKISKKFKNKLCVLIKKVKKLKSLDISLQVFFLYICHCSYNFNRLSYI